MSLPFAYYPPTMNDYVGDHSLASTGQGHDAFPQFIFGHERRGSLDQGYQVSYQQQHQVHDGSLSYAQSACTRTSFDKAPSPEQSAPLDHSEECLSFSPPHSSYSLLDESYKRVDILLSAQLTGLFSREGQLSDYLAPEHTGLAPYNSPVLICYRRNRISIAGHLAVPQNLRCVLTAQGQQIPIESQELHLSAFESLEDGVGGRLVQTLIQREGQASSAANDSDTEGSSPQPIPLTPELAEEASHDQEYTIYPFDWKKLQFRRATVNNGKGPDRQKFFYVSVKILATLADGQKVSICEASSNPIIVRGRGPQNFAKAPSSPEQGRVGRPRSVSATLDGRLKKPDRRSTRNSLLRQSLSRKPMAATPFSATTLQALAAYESSGALSLPVTTAAEAPITPPVTPFANSTQKRDHSPKGSQNHRDASPEPTSFMLPPSQSNPTMHSAMQLPQKDELTEMMKQNFDLPTAGLQILTPRSPPNPETAFGADTRFPFGFISSPDISMDTDAGRESKSPTNANDASKPVFPPTPGSQPAESDASHAVVTSPPTMDMAYFNGSGYVAENPFVMLSDVSSSSPPSMDTTMAMPESLMSFPTAPWQPIPRMQERDGQDGEGLPQHHKAQGWAFG